MKIEPGRGKGHLGGATPLVIRDKKGLLYGWKNIEAVLAGDETHNVAAIEGIELDVYVGWLDYTFPGIVEEAKREVFNEMGPEFMSTDQLRYIDQRIEITQAQGEQLARLQRDDESGLIDEWHRQQGK